MSAGLAAKGGSFQPSGSKAYPVNVLDNVGNLCGLSREQTTELANWLQLTYANFGKVTRPQTQTIGGLACCAATPGRVQVGNLLFFTPGDLKIAANWLRAQLATELKLEGYRLVAGQGAELVTLLKDSGGVSSLDAQGVKDAICHLERIPICAPLPAYWYWALDLGENGIKALPWLRERLASAAAYEQETSIAWNGEGLPPVGCECEVFNSGAVWRDSMESWQGRRVRVRGKHLNQLGQTIVTVEDPEGACACFITECLRPLRTPEQLAAEAREKAIDSLCEKAARLSCRTAGQMHRPFWAAWHDTHGLTG
jgi:hypothetical protein